MTNDPTRQADRDRRLSISPLGHNVPDSLRRLVDLNRCTDCGAVYDVIRCTWAKATHDYAVGCHHCQELVAEGNTFAELEADFQEHMDHYGEIPF